MARSNQQEVQKLEKTIDFIKRSEEMLIDCSKQMKQLRRDAINKLIQASENVLCDGIEMKDEITEILADIFLGEKSLGEALYGFGELKELLETRLKREENI